MSFIFVRVFNTFRQKKVKSSIFGSMSSKRFSGQRKIPTFGLFVDIDGVIVQGEIVIPKVIETLKKLRPSGGEFIVPTVFVTNSSNQLTKEKAEHLTELLGIEIPEDHMVTSHKPFKAFDKLHDKNVFVTGQGRMGEIARSVGFKKIVTEEDFLKVFPMLDAVDITRRVSRPIQEDVEFSPIEAVLMLGEPVRWETSLQLLLDILCTNGDPRRKVQLDYPYPHIPVLVCNMDLLWRFTAQIPRIAHGVFLLCLESAYAKITGKELQYHAMVGKPAVVTFRYAQQLLMEQARKLGIHDEIKTVYMIGDNINTDVFGGNLYNDYLASGEKEVDSGFSIDTTHSVRNCFSVLVKTGVSSGELIESEMNHVHRDFVDRDRKYRQPTHIVQDFSAAIDLIFQLERFG